MNLTPTELKKLVALLPDAINDPEGLVRARAYSLLGWGDRRIIRHVDKLIDEEMALKQPEVFRGQVVGTVREGVEKALVQTLERKIKPSHWVIRTLSKMNPFYWFRYWQIQKNRGKIALPLSFLKELDGGKEGRRVAHYQSPLSPCQFVIKVESESSNDQGSSSQGSPPLKSLPEAENTPDSPPQSTSLIVADGPIPENPEPSEELEPIPSLSATGQTASETTSAASNSAYPIVGQRVGLKELHKEARQTLAGLRLKGVAPDLGPGTLSGRPAEGSIYVKGTDLQTLIEEGWFSFEQGLQIAIGIAEALVEAHKHRIVHMDVKPGNIVVEFSEDGTQVVKVTLIDSEKVILFEHYKAQMDSGYARGTLRYIPVEMLNQLIHDLEDAASAAPKHDIYSLGVTLAELFNFEIYLVDDKGQKKVPPKSLFNGYRGLKKRDQIRQLSNDLHAMRFQEFVIEKKDSSSIDQGGGEGTVFRLVKKLLNMKWGKRPTAKSLADSFSTTLSDHRR